MWKSVILTVAVLLSAHGKAEKKKISPLTETCKLPFVTQNYKPNWQKDAYGEPPIKLYIALESRGAALRAAQTVFGTTLFDTIKDSHLTNSCVRFIKHGGGKYTLKAYNKEASNLYMTPVINAPGTFVVQPTYPGGIGGTAYLSLSDNKNFNVYVVCYDDGLGTFFMTTGQQQLDDSILNIAKEHVKALGFQEDNFVVPNYSLDCDGQLDDVPVPKNLTLVNLLVYGKK